MQKKGYQTSRFRNDSEHSIFSFYAQFCIQQFHKSTQIQPWQYYLVQFLTHWDCSLQKPPQNHAFLLQYIYIRTLSSYQLLSTLLIQFKLVYEPFGQSNIHSTLDVCPRPVSDQPRRKRMYHYITEAKSLLSKYIYCAFCKRHELLLQKAANEIW